MNYINLVLIRLNANTLQFENTEFHGHIMKSDLIKELEKKNVEKSVLKDYEEFLNSKYTERMTIDISNNDKLWFFYIIK